MDASVGIVGGGPAGISAGVQLKRYGIESIIFERNKIGGLIANANLVENTMLHPKGLSGREFVRILEEYVKNYDLRVIFQEVLKVKSKENFRVITEEEEYCFEYLIIATGTDPVKLPYPCVKYHVVDMQGSRYEGIIIIGGGDIALDYSLTMSKRANRVIVIYRNNIKALPILVEYVKRKKNIEFIKGEVMGIIERGDKKEVYTTAGNFVVDDVLAAIGRKSNIRIVEGISHPNLFVIGDAKNGMYRQSSLAIADGIKTAMRIWRFERYGNSE